MKKLLTITAAGLIGTMAYSQYASAGAASVSKTVFTRDGKVCTTITKATRDDFGDVRRVSNTSCRNSTPPPVRSESVFTTSDGRVCKTIMTAARNDFGDVRRVSNTSCRQRVRFVAF